MRISLLFILLLCCALMGMAQTEHRGQTILRMMSYNIHDGIGLDGKTDYNRIAGVISKWSPDVVAVQEVDSATQRAQRVDILRDRKSVV